jgi:4'-phosphopantetheinyl transferase
VKLSWSPRIGSVELSASTVDVWAVRLASEGAPLEEWASVLSTQELERAGQFRLEDPRRRFVVTRVALRMLLGKYLGRPASAIALENDHHGKPRLVRGAHDADHLQFNVAHSGDLALVAVTAGCEVGVDIEQLRPVSHAEHIARRYFHPAEAEALLAAPLSARDPLFLRCWTGKEAVLKAVGRGITGSLASFQVPMNDREDVWIDLPVQSTEGHSRCWLQPLAPCDGYLGAVACLGEERTVRCFAFEG